MAYPILGIDLGTCFTCIYAFINGQFVCIPSFQGNTTPSVIQYRNGNVLIGHEAKATITDYPSQTIYDVKRVIGRSYDACKGLIKTENYGFNCLNISGNIIYEIQDGQNNPIATDPVHVDADFLKALVQRAEQYLGCKVKGAVITVPAYFEYNQIAFTQEAARLAGLRVYPVCYEPTAAAVAANIQAGIDPQYVLVFDLGGGTFDVALIRAVFNDFKVIGNNGHPCLGGRNFDNVVYNIIAMRLADMEVDVNQFTAANKARLRRYAEEIKIELSSSKYVDVDLSDFKDHGKPILDEDDAEFVITREEFENNIKQYIQSAICICDTVLYYTQIKLTANDHVLLVGGSSKIPLVKAMLQDHYGDIIISDNNADEDVARGACMQALRYYCDEYHIEYPIHVPLTHTFVTRPVAVSFGANGVKQPILEMGTSCNEEHEVQSGNCILGTTIIVYSKALPTSNNDNTEKWDIIGKFRVMAVYDHVFIRMYLNEMGCICYSYGNVNGNNTKKGEIDLQGSTSHEEMQRIGKILVAKRDGINLLARERELTMQSTSIYKDQVINILNKALNYLNQESALRQPENSLNGYIMENHNIYCKYILGQPPK